MNSNEPLFTKEELDLIGNRWYFWKGVAIGGGFVLLLLTAIGLLTNY